MNKKEKKQLADNLGLPLSEFNRLLASANHAHKIISELGPFYGNGISKEPTFRIAAQPIPLPKNAKKILTQLGEDLLSLGRSLPDLDDKYKNMLGENLDFRIPPCWRIDVILDTEGNLRVNEIEGVDGASALMIAEQLAYDLKDLKHSTASTLVKTLGIMASKQDTTLKIAYIWPNTHVDPYILNIKRFIKFLETISKGKIVGELFDQDELKQGLIKIDWETFGGVINESSLNQEELEFLGVTNSQIISSGFYNALVNKGLFGLVYEAELKKFWEEKLGEQRFERLKKILINTKFITTLKQLEQAKKQKRVVKVSWAGSKISVMDRSNGVAMPYSQTKHNTEERWVALKQLLKEGLKMISQEYVEPAKIHSFLRKKATNLEAVDWYNRICVKYVCLGNPNSEKMPEVVLTATEVTLGPNIVPAGRECAFTAGEFID